ncbi:MAG: deoxyribodipyrimidine photolyase [Planctomycetaceae bacterium]|nr:deoxyribodipyrimidine photolyase [Planctomycetaceae bacterium]
MRDVPEIRVRVVRDGPVVTDRKYVLYWMVAHRRLNWNFSLQRAVTWCERLRLPLVIFEPLRCDYAWASDRLHWFFIQGMKDQKLALDDTSVFYYPYLEPKVGAGRGLLAALSQDAAVIVTDDYPCIFVPQMIHAAGEQVSCRLEAVDSNGVLPLRLAEKTYARAVDFRRFMHRSITTQLAELPLAEPMNRLPHTQPPVIDSKILARWPVAPVSEMTVGDLANLPIDHSMTPVTTIGGSQAAQRRLAEFLSRKLNDYEKQRRNVDQIGTSQLSPYLRYGHVSAHEVVTRVLEYGDWSPERINPKKISSNQGFWGLDEASESFLDELITWRELGFNMCCREPNYDQYESLPNWAKQTLEKHRTDQRPATYELEQFEHAQTYDKIWNAAQRQLVQDGIIHNYLRMLWGKKILHWSSSPQRALEIMIHLNNKYAIDGRDPNSYSGIFWVLGRYDRAWGPEREVFGQIRYMTSDSTEKKINLKSYLQRYSDSVLQ